MKIRGSGILLHVTSLPSAHGVGDLGPAAYAFADLLSNAAQTYWQVLPLGPTSPAIGNSPYSSFSAFAGNPLLVSLDALAKEGLLTMEDLQGYAGDTRRVDYGAAEAFKMERLHRAHARWQESGNHDGEYAVFCEMNRSWLDDYAQFMALKERFHGAVWVDWPERFRDRDQGALAEAAHENAQRISFEKFRQYEFFKQWAALKRHAGRRKVHLIGDMPIYVTFDSADVWVNWRLFKLNGDKRPTHVAGVPPDYFSETGQLWGNPVYNWDAMKRERYRWWVERMEHNLRLYDYIRLDHFRGFAGYWEVPAGEETAVNGEWVDAPGEEFFATLYRHMSSLPIIAEDLGVITPDVRELKLRFGFPGMKILQFGFGWDLPVNKDAPHNYDQHCIVYSGTHDNNTVQGWFAGEAAMEDKERFLRYLGGFDDGEVHWRFIRLALMSVANTAIFPMQDVLGLGAEARMNTPSISNGNWEWRLLPEEMEPEALERLADMTRFYGRI